MSPFYLLYGTHPCIPLDLNDNNLVDTNGDPVLDHLPKVNHAQVLANKLLLNHMIQMNKICNLLVKESNFEPRTWVLVQNEGPEKFQPHWFSLYKVLKAHPLRTYALEEPNSEWVLWNLINGNHLIEANVKDPEGLWSSSTTSRALKWQGLSIKKPVEVWKIVDRYKPDPMSYQQLSAILKKEWEDHVEAHSKQVGEEEIAEKILLTCHRCQAKSGCKPNMDISGPDQEMCISTRCKPSINYDEDLTALETSSVAGEPELEPEEIEISQDCAD